MNEEMITLIVIAAGIASLTSLVAAWISLTKSRTQIKSLKTSPIEELPSFELLPSNLVTIPIVSNIAAGLVRPIADENIEDHLLLSENYGSGANFGVKVFGDSMKDSGILSGDIALIRQRPTVEDGEIAAVVITTPKESLEVIKRYYHDQREGLEHWFLESSNPSSKHLIVTPGGANTEAIQALYAKEIQVGKVELYKNAELAIAGKYVGLMRKI
jgi:SOS-response transcriptional repressor LexA